MAKSSRKPVARPAYKKVQAPDLFQTLPMEPEAPKEEKKAEKKEKKANQVVLIDSIKSGKGEWMAYAGDVADVISSNHGEVLLLRNEAGKTFACHVKHTQR